MSLIAANKSKSVQDLYCWRHKFSSWTSLVVSSSYFSPFFNWLDPLNSRRLDAVRLLTRILAYSHARTRARTRIRSRQLKKLTLSIPSSLSLSLSVFRSLSQPSRFCDCFNATRSLSCSLSQVRQASYCSSCCLLSLLPPPHLFTHFNSKCSQFDSIQSSINVYPI